MVELGLCPLLPASSDEAESSDEEAFEEAFEGVFEDEFDEAGGGVEVEERPERVPLKEPEGGGNIVVDEKDHGLCEPVDTEPRSSRFEPLLGEAHERVVKPVAVVGGDDEDIPKAFFTIQMADKKDFWKFDTWWPEHAVVRESSMSSYRFQQIKAALHLEDPSSTPSVSLDEVLIRFTGRSFYVVNMRSKPTPIGYYILALCERGYLLEIAGVVRPREVTIAKAQKAAKKVVVKRKKKDNSTRNEVVAAPAAPAAATLLPPPPLLPNPDDSVNLTSELADRSKAVVCLILHTLRVALAQGKFFYIYIDNLFSNVPLYAVLRAYGIAATGTIRNNSKLWPWQGAEFKRTKKGVTKLVKLARKTTNFPFDLILYRPLYNVSAVLWQDRQLVQFLTTGYTIDERVNRLRRKPRPVNAFIREHVRPHWQEAREHKLVPLVAAYYNDYIGGVDIHDQLRSYCST
ncbi:uncharacterized protein MYCGRDRAFT_95983 [Zymoseptoria tritici IPO323]|uniref:PiggyBac transposable element-derived protein domain-containing protein n=1 Tax=Zymoseptoria tritici (strain CBS 115943 / IPO323) TaxID=336722 RepID=F9XKH4_ZYMTI|nr:uncharacterized protein MYCGRDRAFT_95983 [Zymoseptoria tritici IPO323]EGP84536.1 hypothetical protein MYCGRDRAFT_95983 [Zymoseptoria tritici IPO323]